VCGSRKNLEVHHKRPFHLFPKRELDPTNLITLCEGKGGGCHLHFGHLFCFSSFNPKIDEDAAEWAVKIRARPR
jgi:5-methylcytosine-specific restriction protein A